jgi:hypothetical protein
MATEKAGDILRRSTMQAFDRNQISVQVSAQPLAGGAASLIGKETVKK